MPIKDLKNQKFNRLLVLFAIKKRSSSGGIIWRCLCDCGNTVNVLSTNLVENRTKSCGCLNTESLIERSTKHGACKSIYKEGSTQLDYVIWSSMKQRCYDKNNENYSAYGGRGISVCKEWKSDFTKFAKYIRGLANCPSEKLLVSRRKGRRLKMSIDRINNDGNYEPGNIKWSTSKEQSLNKRTNKIFKYNHLELPLIELHRLYSVVAYGTLVQRIIAGWTIEEALTTPSRNKN